MDGRAVKNAIHKYSKDNKKTVLFLFLLALGARLIYVFFFEQYPLMQDDLYYNIIAKNILQGNGFSYDSANPAASRGPLYPLFLAVTYFVFGHDYNAVRVLQAIIGAITCVLIYLIGKKAFNAAIGCYASLIAAIYPALVGFSGFLFSETLAAFLLSLAILFYFFSIDKKTLFMFIITGLIFGLLILCYPKFLFLPFIFGLSVYFFNKFRMGFFKYFLGLIVGVVFAVTPWTLRNFNKFGKFIPVATGAGTTLWYATLPQDNIEWQFNREPLLSEFKRFFRDPQSHFEQEEFFFSVRTNEFFARKALNNIRSKPLLFFKLSAKRFFRQWFSSNGNSFYMLRGTIGSYLLNKNYGILFTKILLALFQAYIILFGCLGILTEFNSQKKNIFSPILLSILYSSIINSIFITEARYQIPVLGLLFIYAAVGSRWAFLRISKTKELSLIQ